MSFSIAAVIAWVLAHLNYWVIFLGMAIESSFIPFPSEAVVPPAAWLAQQQELNIFFVVIVATLGADAGALINYLLARTLGRPIIYRFADSRIGHLCLLDRAGVQKAEHFFRRHGIVSTFFGRLVPGVRQLISIPAGLAGMNIGKFLLYTTLGAGVWNTILAFLGYYLIPLVFPQLSTTAEVMEHATRYSHEIGYVCLTLVIFALLFFCYKFWSRRSQKDEVEAVTDKQMFPDLSSEKN